MRVIMTRRNNADPVIEPILSATVPIHGSSFLFPRSLERLLNVIGRISPSSRPTRIDSNRKNTGVQEIRCLSEKDTMVSVLKNERTPRRKRTGGRDLRMRTAS